jgi:protein TonB
MLWWNFLIVFLVIFLLGVVIGFMVIPHPSKVEEEAPAEKALSGKVETSEEIEPIRATEDIKPPKLIKKVEPIYPEVARQARVEGVVILEATTDIYGRVQRVRVLRSIPLLDKAAIDAVKQWVYEPMVVDGDPKGVVFTVTVRFMLDDEKKEDKDKLVSKVVGTIPLEGVTDEVQPPVKAEGDITPPKIIKRVEPVYPEEARKEGIEGEVILEVQTDIYGRIKRAKVVQSVDPHLDKAAVDAVRQWVYEPKIVEGSPRGVIFSVTVTFNLK